MTLETDGSARPTGLVARRGFRVALGLSTAMALLLTLGVTGRLLAPDPTDDPCTAVPSELVREFFPDGSVAVIRTSLPDSSRQRCVWLPGADTAMEDAAYRRVQLTFGLADRDAYLERMRSSTVGNSGSGAETKDADESEASEDPSTVEIDESRDGAAKYRLATVQRGRVDGEHDIVVELSASVRDSDADRNEVRELVVTMAERLRPLRETALHQAPESDSWMLAGAGDGLAAQDAVRQLMSDGLGIADSVECARVPAGLIDDLLGDHRRVPTLAGCSWQSDQRRTSPTDGPPPGILSVRFGVADEPVTARDAYAELSFVSDPTGYTVVDRHRSTVDELGDGVRSRIVTGRYVLPGDPTNATVRVTEVVAVRGRFVVAVQYGTQVDAQEQQPPERWTDRAESAALRLVESLLSRG